MPADLTHRIRFQWLFLSLLVCLSLVVCRPKLSFSSPAAMEGLSWSGGPVRPAWGFEQGAREREEGSISERLDVLCGEPIPGDDQLKLFLERAGSAIRDLDAKVRRTPSDADAWSDLAAAHLCRFEGSGRGSGEATDLFAALWAADQAVTVGQDYPHVAGQFNLALALDLLSLDELASEAWSIALAHRPPEPWRSWAVERKLQVSKRLTRASTVRAARIGIERALRQGEVPAPGDMENAAAYLRTEIQNALPFALRAFAENPRSPASESRIVRLLELANRRNGKVKGRFAGEILVHDRRLLLEAGPKERRRLILAFDALIAGLEASRRRAFGIAEPLLRNAASELRELGSSLALSADLEWLEALQAAAVDPGNSDEKQGESDRREEEQLFERLRGRATLADYPKLRARFLWLDGLAIAKRGGLIEGLKRLDESYGLYRDLAEPQNQAAVDGIRAEILRVLGRFRASWEARARALREATEGADPGWLYNALIGAANDAHDEGWSPLDQRLNREALRVAESHRIYIRVVEAEILRAKGLLADASANPTPALLEAIGENLENARLALEQVDRDSTPHGPLSRDLEKTRAELSDLEEPEKALWAAWSDLEDSRRSDLVAELPLQYARAVDLTLATGRRLGSNELRAQMRLRALQLAEAGMKEILRQTPSSSSSAVERKAFLDPYRRTAQALTELLVERGESELALDWILAVFQAEATGGSPGSEEGVRGLRGRLALQDHEGLLVLQTAREGIYGWLVVGPSATTFSFQVAAKEVRPLLSDLESELAASLSQERGQAQPALSATPLVLSEALLGALRGRLSGLEKLTVLPSEDLRGLPFGALMSPDSGKFLAVDLEVHVALPAARGRSRRAPERSLRATSSALFVGNPYNVDAAREGLADLPFAAKEAKDGAGRFGHATLLTGRDAEKSAVLRKLQEVDFAHFGVHAVRGATGTGLLLGSPGEERNKGFLAGDEIGGLRLRLDLVVLSACRSAEPGHPAAGLDGLVEAFLAAGSDTVIASLWNVDDEASKQLWDTFYEEVVRGSSPAAALRRAQRKLMEQPNLANPAYWAGFAVYHGNLPMKGE